MFYFLVLLYCDNRDCHTYSRIKDNTKVPEFLSRLREYIVPSLKPFVRQELLMATKNIFCWDQLRFSPGKPLSLRNYPKFLLISLRLEMLCTEALIVKKMLLNRNRMFEEPWACGDDDGGEEDEIFIDDQINHCDGRKQLPQDNNLSENIIICLSWWVLRHDGQAVFMCVHLWAIQNRCNL